MKGWFAAPPAGGYWVRRPASGRRYDKSSDWSGGFGVCDHSWGNSQAGDWLYSVREAGWVPDSKLSPAFVRYVDTTRLRGDLYYIQNVAALLKSWAQQERL